MTEDLDLDEMWPTIDLVKQTVTMVEIAEMLGYEADMNDKVRPPWNEGERTPSCQLYEDHWYDFSSGKHGDFVDFIKEVDPTISTSKAISLAWRRALKSGHEPGDVEVVQPRTIVDFTEELSKYTWMDPVMGRFGVRLDGDTQLVPHRDESGTYGVKTRGYGKGAWPGSQFTHRLYCPYGWAFSLPVGGKLVICEGESDAWAMVGAVPAEVRVLALPSGASCWKKHWSSDLAHFQEIYICFDNDGAGKSATDKVLRAVGWDHGRELRVPQLYNDAREAIEAGWDPTTKLYQ